MALNEEEITELLNKLNSKERGFKNRSIFTIAILLTFGATWLIWTNSQVNVMKREVASLNIEIRSLNDTLASKKKDVIYLEGVLHEADNFKQSKFNLRPDAIKHLLYNNDLGVINKLFGDIKNFQYNNVRFKLDGKNPEDGFNSPSMISYVLKKHGLNESIATNSSQLIKQMLVIEGEMRTGDVIVYESGYSMLYVKYKDPYRNEDPEEFVIGMTPFGILELKLDFAKKLKVLRIKNFN